jgi:hypothetical protein
MGGTLWLLATEVMVKILGIQGDDMRGNRFERVESNYWRGKIERGFKIRIQSETTVRQNMGRTHWLLATEAMVKILGNADSRRRCARDGFERVESNDLRGKIECGFIMIQSDTTVRQNMGTTL